MPSITPDQVTALFTVGNNIATKIDAEKRRGPDSPTLDGLENTTMVTLIANGFDQSVIAGLDSANQAAFAAGVAQQARAQKEAFNAREASETESGGYWACWGCWFGFYALFAIVLTVIGVIITTATLGDGTLIYVALLARLTAQIGAVAAQAVLASTVTAVGGGSLAGASAICTYICIQLGICTE